MTTRKNNFRHAVLRAALAFAGMALVAPGTARAGFEWTPPPAPPPAVQAIGPDVQAMPVSPVDETSVDPAMADLTPVDHVNVDPAPFAPQPMPETSGAPEVSRAADVAPVVPRPPVAAQAAAPVIQPVIEQPIPAPKAAEAPLQDDAREYAVAEGFGRDIPLALMMQQVVPSGYAYSFDPQINLGMRVSWDGGKPWNVVLKEALAPYHVAATVSGMTVWLHPATAEEPAPAPVETAQTISARPEAAPAATPRDPVVSRLSDIESMDYEAREKKALAVPVPQPPREAVTDPVKLAEIGARGDDYHPSYPRREKPQEKKARMPLMLPSSAPAAEKESRDPVPATQPAAPASLAPQPQPAEAGPQTASAEPAPVSLPPPSEGIAPPTRIFPADDAAGDKMAEALNPAAPELSPAPDAKSGPYDPFQIFFWQSEKEASLKDTLERWAGMAGVRLYWNAGGDYSIPKEIRMHGTFPDAVTAVLGTYGESPDRPFGRLHPNQPNGPAVLIIQSSGSAKAVN